MASISKQNALKILKVIGKWVFGVVVALYVLTVIINWSDESPAPGYIRYVAYDIPAQVSGANALFMMEGLDAPADADPIVYGRQKYERLLRNHRSGHLPSGPAMREFDLAFDLGGATKHESDDHYRMPYGDIFETLSAGSKNSKKYVKMQCDENEPSCLGYYWNQRAVIEPELRNNALPLSRLNQLYGMEFQDVISRTMLDAATPILAYNNYANHLLARSALSAKNGEVDKAIADLISFGDFHRRMGANSQLIIGKAVGHKNVRKAAKLASDMLRELPLSRAQQQKLVPLLRPLAPEMLDYRDAYRMELMSALNMIGDIKRSDSLMEMFIDNRFLAGGVNFIAPNMFQPQATRNLFYAMGGWLDKLGRADDKGIRTAVERDDATQVHAKMFSINLGLWYNPVGKALAGIHMPGYAQYKSDAHNTSLYLMMVRLQFAAAEESNRATALARLAEKSINPATDKPVTYDPATGMLSTEGLKRKLDKASGERKWVPITVQALGVQ